MKTRQRIRRSARRGSLIELLVVVLVLAVLMAMAMFFLYRIRNSGPAGIAGEPWSPLIPIIVVVVITLIAACAFIVKRFFGFMDRRIEQWVSETMSDGTPRTREEVKRDVTAKHGNAKWFPGAIDDSLETLVDKGRLAVNHEDYVFKT